MATGELEAVFPNESPEDLLLQNLAPILYQDTTEVTDRRNDVGKNDSSFIAEQCTPSSVQNDSTRESRKSSRKKRPRMRSRSKGKRSKKRKTICSEDIHSGNSESHGPVGKVDWEKKLNKMRGED